MYLAVDDFTLHCTDPAMNAFNNSAPNEGFNANTLYTEGFANSAQIQHWRMLNVNNTQAQ